MNGLWPTLVPLIIGSALVPAQIVLTLLLLRSTAGRFTAVAFVAGMLLVRLVQGAVFGLLVASSDVAGASADSSGSGTVTSVVLLVVAVLLYVTAAKQLLGDVDPDAPPPRWLTMAETMGPAKAFGFGVALIAVGPKFWVFTLGAISAIGDADLGRPEGAITFLVFAVLASAVQLAALVFAYAAPARADAVLGRASAWLEEKNRVIVIVLGVVFGTWFLLEALDGLGVL